MDTSGVGVVVCGEWQFVIRISDVPKVLTCFKHTITLCARAALPWKEKRKRERKNEREKKGDTRKIPDISYRLQFRNL